MPSVSEKQRKMMAIAEHEPGKLYAKNKGVLKMSHSQLHDYAVKSKMPKGGTQSPHGDLGELRGKESARAFKNSGPPVSASKALPYRTPKVGIDAAFGPGDKVC